MCGSSDRREALITFFSLDKDNITYISCSHRAGSPASRAGLISCNKDF